MSSFSGDTKQGNGRIVFMGGLPLGTTRQELLSLLQRYGQVLWIDLPKDLKTGRIRGFANAAMATSKGFNNVVKSGTLTLRGSQIGVQPWVDQRHYLKHKDSIAQRKIFVRFQATFSKDELHNYFKQFGNVEQIDLRLDLSTRIPRNIAFVIFESEDAAHRASGHQNHRYHGKSLTCQPATPYFITQKEKMIHLSSHQDLDKQDQKSPIRSTNFGFSPTKSCPSTSNFQQQSMVSFNNITKTFQAIGSNMKIDSSRMPTQPTVGSHSNATGPASFDHDLQKAKVSDSQSSLHDIALKRRSLRTNARSSLKDRLPSLSGLQHVLLDEANELGLDQQEEEYRRTDELYMLESLAFFEIDHSIKPTSSLYPVRSRGRHLDDCHTEADNLRLNFPASS